MNKLAKVNSRKLLTKKLPQGTKSILEIRSALLQGNVQLLAVIDNVLAKRFKFTDRQIGEVHSGIIKIAHGVNELEKRGLRIFSLHDINLISELTERKYLDQLAPSGPSNVSIEAGFVRRTKLLTGKKSKKK